MNTQITLSEAGAGEGAGTAPDWVPDDTVDSDEDLPGPRPVPVFTQPNSLGKGTVRNSGKKRYLRCRNN